MKKKAGKKAKNQSKPDPLGVLVDQVDEKIKTLESENASLKDEIAILKTASEEYRRQCELLENRLYLYQAAGGKTPPETFDGWNVRMTEKGYIELFKEIGGAEKQIYIGKVWSPEKAREKIADAEDLPRMIFLSVNVVSGTLVPFCSRKCCRKAGYDRKPENMWVDYHESYPDRCACCGKSFV